MRIIYSPTISIIANREDFTPAVLLEAVFRLNGKSTLSPEYVYEQLSNFTRKTVRKWLRQAEDLGILTVNERQIVLHSNQKIATTYFKTLNDETLANWFYRLSKIEVQIVKKKVREIMSGEKRTLRAFSFALTYFCVNNKENANFTSQGKLADYLNICEKTITNAIKNNSFIRTVDCVIEVPDFFDPQYHSQLIQFNQQHNIQSPILFRQSGSVELRRPSAVISTGYHKQKTLRLKNASPDASNLGVKTDAKSQTSTQRKYSVLSHSRLLTAYESKLLASYLKGVYNALDQKDRELFFSIFTYHYRKDCLAALSKSDQKTAAAMLRKSFCRIRISDQAYRRTYHATTAHAGHVASKGLVPMNVMKQSEFESLGITEMTFSQFFKRFVFARNPGIVRLPVLKQAKQRKQRLRIPQFSVFQDSRWNLPYQEPKDGREYVQLKKNLKIESSPFYVQFYNMQVNGTANILSYCRILAMQYGINLDVNKEEIQEVINFCHSQPKVSTSTSASRRRIKRQAEAEAQTSPFMRNVFKSLYGQEALDRLH